ncbi:hypothetical protein JCM16303_007198 [Sporobolomyces ruberrimus]
MATIERSYTLEQGPTRSIFNPSAIPSAPPFALPLHASTSEATATNGLDTDLIDLGQERLFSGTRTRATRQDQDQDETTVGSSGDREDAAPRGTIQQQQQKDELMGSLGDAKQAFVLALDSLLQPYISQTPEQRSSLAGQAGSSTPSSSSAVPFTNPFVDPTAILAPFRRHSLAPPSASVSRRPSAAVASTSSSLQSSDFLLFTLVETLRGRTDRLSAFQMRSIEATSPLANTFSSANSSNRSLLDELHSQIEICAPDLSTTDAELARSLGSLLICIDRLASISVALSGLSTLEEESEQRGHRAVGAAREVEQAERDLLWGRVDDLSEKVRTLTQQRAESAQEDEDEDEVEERSPKPRSARASLETFQWSPRSRDVAWDAQSLSSLPSYNLDSDVASPNLPPGYFPQDFLDLKDGHDWDIKTTLSPRSPSQLEASTSTATDQPVRRIRKVSSMQSEKMQRDLDSVSQAIERLYDVSPQLANQRVEPDRRLLRERQLAKLGNAIERLSQGRLDDQRAKSLPATVHQPETQAERSRREREAVDKLIERIDRAASRTLADQRVELNGKRRALVADNELSKPLTALSDPREAKRREYILEHTGKGRLAGQDAILHSSGLVEPFPGPPPELSEAVTISEFFSEETPRSRSDSIASTESALRKKSSNRSLSRGQTAGEEESTPTTKSSLRIGMLKGFGSRRGSTVDIRVETGASAMSRSQSSNPREILAVPQFDWITEESRNLGSLVVTFWPRDSAATSSKDEFEIVSVEAESLVVGPARGGPASRLSLPSRVIPQQATVTSSGVYHEVKLVTISPSPTKSRADLEVHVPLTVAELRESMPVSFACSACHTEIVDSSSITRYNALPSEHWAELLDAWMCHPDQTLSQDLISKGKGIKPRTDEGLVGTSYILFPRDSTKNWSTPLETQPTRSPSDDHLYDARCTCCSALVGYHVTPLAQSDESPTSFRLVKYAAYPLVGASSTSTGSAEYSLACHLTAEMLETGQAHACHRFVLEDSEQEKPRLLLWFFNPAIRVSFSTSSPLASSLHASRRNSTDSTKSGKGTGPKPAGTVDLISRSMNAVKVFFTVVTGPDDPRVQDFIENKTETVTYPLSVVEQLKKLLEASTLVYPLAKRRFGNFETGFLERI